MLPELFASSVSSTYDIVFDKCIYYAMTYGMRTSSYIRSVTISNSNFNLLYQGISLGTGTLISGGPTGWRITNSVFNIIYDSGIIFGYISLNVSGYNIFYDVANHFQGASNPQTSIIIIQGNNNVSIGDMFQRSDTYSTIYPRIALTDTVSIATTNGSQIQLGTKTIQSGLIATLAPNIPTATTTFTIDTSSAGVGKSFDINYSIERDAVYRTGTLSIASGQFPTAVTYTDNYTENYFSGISLSVIQAGYIVSVQYTSTAGVSAQLSYSISYFN